MSAGKPAAKSAAPKKKAAVRKAAAAKVTSNAHARERKPRIVFSAELLATILDRVAGGEPLSKVCNSPDMPTRKAFLEWVAKDPSIREQYEFAMQMRADLYADEIISIADDGLNDTYLDDEGNARTNADVVARSKLRVDARKWYASKLAPKKYGERQQVDLNANVAMSAEKVDERLAELMMEAQKRRG